MLIPALVLAVDTVAAFMGPGVSRQLAEHRARTISEVRYDLALDVTPLDSALGEVTVRFRRTGSGDLVIDFRGRRCRRRRQRRLRVPSPPAPGERIA
jgi:hypothetical protein